MQKDTLHGERLGSVTGSLLIALRLAAAPLFVAGYLYHRGLWPLVALAVALVTDALDGRVGRRWGGRPFLGAWSDALADFVFVVASFAAFVISGLYPLWALFIILAMFAQFLLTSRRDGPVHDPTGKYYGVFLFACIGVTLIWPHELVCRGVPAALAIVGVASLVNRVVWLSRAARERSSAQSTIPES
ncbi:MAG TPA: hypothetical protein GX702_07205 [Chloroflexi bacterium]|jgi:phosphatidylglycerophosphate synthase|nr:hypothetical protein [Chloroflexota bacterium]